jgi:hypothetical protein
MRRVGAFVACVVLAAALAGCNSDDARYLRDGIGTNLGTEDLPAVTQLQDIYVGEICRQAGLRVSQQGEVLLCDEVSMRPSEWTTFVQAGMNDIDRRCDAYLAWIDNKKRSREPILKQINDTSAATAAILGLTGVGPGAIAIVGTAFGFAQATFTNYESRLITEVDHSVVQSVVLDYQNQFRIKLADVPIDNRPAAIYLLRNYLRICMPFSIEMSINNTITTFHRGGADALKTEPLLTRAPTVAAITSAREPLRPTAGPKTQVIGAKKGPETALDPEDVRKLQALLCLPQTGGLGPATRTGIRIYKRSFLVANANGDLGRAEIKQIIRDRNRFGDCDRSKYRNYYERTTLITTDDILALQRELNTWPLGGMVPETGVLDAQTRTKIAAVRAGLTGLSEEAEVSNQVTPDFRVAIRKPH